MAHKTGFVLFLICIVTLSAASACRQGAPTATPELPATAQVAETAVSASPVLPDTSVPPTFTPLPTDTPWPTDTPGPDHWSGTTSQGTAFEFDVQGDQIVFFNASYQGQKGSCTFMGSFGDYVQSPVVGNQFTIDWKEEAGNAAHIVGTFTSEGQASGTIDYTDNVKEICDMSMHLTWSALSSAALSAGTPIAPPATLPVARLNGRWEGKNSDGYQVYFDVVDEQITYVFFNFSVNTGSCSYGGAMGETFKKAEITDQSFSVDLQDEDGQLYTFAGSFTSDNEAAGTIHIKGVAGTSCGVFEEEMTWTTQKGDDQGGSAPPTETAIPRVLATPTVSVGPIAVVQGFFDAYNAGNSDAALAFVEDGVMFTLGSASGKVGKGNLKAFLTEQQQKGVTFTISNLKVIGDILKFSAQASDGTAYPDSQTFTDAGKISLLTLR